MVGGGPLLWIGTGIPKVKFGLNAMEYGIWMKYSTAQATFLLRDGVNSMWLCWIHIKFEDNM